MRTICFSESKSSVARAFASSVFPTPVGPKKRKEPVGWCSRPNPARERSTASATASTARLQKVSMVNLEVGRGEEKRGEKGKRRGAVQYLRFGQ